MRRARLGLAAFALAAVAVLATFCYLLAGVPVGAKHLYYADYGYAAGLEVGAPVKVSGIKVGQVREMRLLTATSLPPAAASKAAMGQDSPAVVRVRLALRGDAAERVTADTAFSVVTTGIIGDAFLDMAPGTGLPAMEGSALRGVDAPRLHEMALAAQVVFRAVAPLFVAAELTPTPASVGAPAPGCVGTPMLPLLTAASRVLMGLDAHLQAYGNAWGEVATRGASVFAALQTGVGDGAQLGGLRNDVAQLFAALHADVPTLTRRANAALTHADNILQRIDAHVTEPELVVLQRDAYAVLTHLGALAEAGQSLVLGLQRGEGTLGAMLRDPQLYDDLQALVHDLRAHPYKLFWRR